jgi:adenine-specific DNA-methyltransferase
MPSTFTQMAAPPAKLQRLNYIGSKFQLLEWLQTTMLAKTGWADFRGRRVADLFAGTGVVSHHFRCLGAAVHTNDAELYSAVIARAFTTGCYTDAVRAAIEALNSEIAAGQRLAGPITRHYAPFEGCERMFFTVDNAQRIDYLRRRIETFEGVDAEERNFLLATLLLAADAVSNVPAVYGCYLKKFKAKAQKGLTLVPVHGAVSCVAGSRATSADITGLTGVQADLVYLDPPYNNRQYSKNYFPLNVIALGSTEAAIIVGSLKGKTGIPEGCFLSPFCGKEGAVLAAFKSVLDKVSSQWVFISYNSESTVSKEKMLALLGTYGEVSVVERDYKRFKSFEYNEDKKIVEFLFCLKRA